MRLYVCLLFNYLIRWIFSLLNVLLLWNSIGRVFKFLAAFDFWNLLIFWSIQCCNELGLFSLKISFPDHCQRITSSSRKIITIFWERACISTSIMAIKSILKASLVDFPDFNLCILRSCNHIVVFRMKIYFCNWFSMSIIILDKPFTSKVI